MPVANVNGQEDKEDKHPILRLSKWIGAIVGIVSFIVALVSGVWRTNQLLDDLDRAHADLTALRASVESSREDSIRRSEIQEEILNNLRIAVASIQAVAEYRNRAETPPSGGAGATVATARVRHPPPVTSGSARMTVRTPPVTPVRTPPEPDDTSPEVAEMIRRLPPLPSALPDEPYLSGDPAPPPDFPDLASDRADVALERAEILQDAL